MISVIICSREAELANQLVINIKESIGCEYEIIIVNNQDNKYSISQAYNIGIEKSKGEMLCFIHEDVLFHTMDWGVEVINIYNSNPKIGLIGVAGAKIKTKTSSPWWDCPEKYKVMHIIQHDKNINIYKSSIGFAQEEIQEVAVIDGVFMVLRKEIFVQFDELNEGFHCYDLKISLDVVKKKYKVVVSNKILIEHYSIGLLDLNWFNSLLKFHKKNKNYLPLNISDDSIIAKEEFNSCKKLVFYCIKFGRLKLLFRYWIKLFFMNPISREHFDIVKYLVLKK